MRGLAGLIRLKRWELEEDRRKVGELHRLHAQIRTAMQDLEAELQRAHRQSGETEPAVQFVFGSYVQNVRDKQAKLAESLAEIDAAIIAATDQLAEKFREVKRYEIVRDRQAQAAAAKVKKREADELDNLGLLPFVNPDSPV